MVRLTGHALADERSLALHREVARRLRQDPTLLARASERVRAWESSGATAKVYVEAWRALLEAGVPAVLEAIEDPGERGQALRQVSPFAFVIPARERWRLLRDLSSERTE